MRQNLTYTVCYVFTVKNRTPNPTLMVSFTFFKKCMETFFFCMGSVLRTFKFHRTVGEGGGYLLTPFYHFHSFYGHLDVSRRLLQRAHLYSCKGSQGQVANHKLHALNFKKIRCVYWAYVICQILNFVTSLTLALKLEKCYQILKKTWVTC